MNRRIHITGASGSGTTTLGAHLAARLACPHFDTDDFYWLQTDPPFQLKREIPDRLLLLSELLNANPGWILSGSVAGWGDPLIPLFGTVVYLTARTEVRLSRLRCREMLRYGSVNPEFLTWAASYDSGTMPGRSRPRHRAWLAKLPCSVLELDGERPLSELAEEVLRGAAGRDTL
jgi:hypothetical protein